MTKQYMVRLYTYDESYTSQKPRFEMVVHTPEGEDQLPVGMIKLLVEARERELGFICSNYTVEPMPIGSDGLVTTSVRFGRE